MFVLSKLLSAITQPLFWLTLWWALGLLALRRWPRGARSMLWAGLAVLGLLGFRAIPDALLRPLENRYPVPGAQALDRHVGIIVLGGAFEHAESFEAHAQVPLNAAAERLTVPLALLRSHAQWPLLFTGGEGTLLKTGIKETALAAAFYEEQGIDASRIWLEDQARTTRENAQRTAAMLGQRCTEPWLLVTSAWHMPRAMQEFDAVGCNVTPYPVDFRTGNSTAWTEYSLAFSLVRWQTALHEWVGMAAYRVTLTNCREPWLQSNNR